MSQSAEPVIAESNPLEVADAHVPTEPVAPEPDTPESTAPEDEPASSRASRRAAALTTASIASFSLTLLGGGIAVLAGAIPLEHLSVGQRTDIGALLLAVPVVALTLAMVFEVTRIALRPALPDPHPRQVVRWSPGHREG